MSTDKMADNEGFTDMSSKASTPQQRTPPAGYMYHPSRASNRSSTEPIYSIQPSPIYPESGARYHGPPSLTQDRNTVPVREHTGPPRDYFGLSIFTLIFCNLICGVIAFVYAKEAKDKYSMGNRPGAVRASKMSLILNIAAIATGVVTVICALCVYYFYWKVYVEYSHNMS